ncbi:MAG: PAS domain S-box protein [Desulfosarcinaceae bacterium]|nr:PAS domain S-box protein [Desulfosarcinaceae bacterium]
MNLLATSDRLRRIKPKTLSLRVIGLLSLLVLMTVGLFLYGLYIYERGYRFQSPLVTAIKEIRLELAGSRFFVDNAIEHRTQINQDHLWHYVDRSLWYLQQLALPGNSQALQAIDNRSRQIDSELASLIEDLRFYKTAMQTLIKKWNADLLPGDDAQNLFDRSYQAFQVHLDALDRAIHDRIHHDRLRFRTTQISLAFVFLLVSAGLIRASYIHEKRKMENYHALKAANLRALQESRDRLKTAKALERSEHLFRTVFQTSPDAFVLSHLDSGMIVDVNEGFTQLSGIQREDAVGKRLVDADFWHSPEDYHQLRHQIETEGRVRNAVVTFTLPSMGMRIGSITAKVIHLDSEPHVLTVVRDITELKLAEETLRQSEQQFRSLFESTSDAIQVLDPDGLITLTNPATVDQLGYAEDEIVGRPLVTFVKRKERPTFQALFESLKSNGFHRDELELVTKEGATLMVDSSIATIRDDGDNIRSFVISHKDITARKLSDRRNQALFRFLKIANHHRSIDGLLDSYAEEVESITGCDAVAIRIIGENGYLPFTINRGFAGSLCEKEAQVPLDENGCMCGRVIRRETDGCRNYFSPQGSFLTHHSSELLSRLEPSEREEIRGICNRYGFESLALIPILDRDQTIGIIHLASQATHQFSLETIEILEAAAMQMGTALRRLQFQDALSRSHTELENRIQKRTRELEREVDEHRRTEKALLQNQKRLRKLSSRVMVAEASERRRIATDIHDRIGQTLAITKIRLGSLADELVRRDQREVIEDVRKLITRTIQDTRTLTFELSPPVLYEIGLEAAIEWLGSQIATHTQLPVVVESNSRSEQVSTALRIFLFQSVRELLHNIVKHAQASAAHVQVHRTYGTYKVCVSDDGQGLDTAYRQKGRKGYGLFNIQESMELYGGTMRESSRPGQGTLFAITMPLKIPR